MKIGKFGLINNFLPYYLIEKNGRYEVVESSPRELSEMLLRGDIVYAPVPSYFYIKKKDVLDRHSFCVSSDGEVFSVVVVSRRKRLDDSPIAVTSKSMTSSKMMEIIKKERGMINRLVTVDGDFMEVLRDFDHALVIGDEAIKARMVFRVVMDMGEEWKEITGLPAVFGIATSRKGFEQGKAIDSDVIDSYRKGMEMKDEIVEIASLKFRMPAEFLSVYFSRLVHEAGGKEIKSLEVFEELVNEHGLH